MNHEWNNIQSKIDPEQFDRVAQLLKIQLKEAGFMPRKKILTPKQIEILINFLGEP